MMKNMDKRQKILIVDDSNLNRDILKEILGDTYNYLEAENGNQAIQMIGENIGEPSGQGRWLIMCPYWLDMCPCKKV